MGDKKFTATADNFSIIDKIKAQGSYLNNEKRYSDMKFLYWDTFGSTHICGYVLACIFTLGILAFVRYVHKKRHERKIKKAGRRIQMNNIVKESVSNYIERKIKGEPIKKQEEKIIKKLLKKGYANSTKYTDYGITKEDREQLNAVVEGRYTDLNKGLKKQTVSSHESIMTNKKGTLKVDNKNVLVGTSTLGEGRFQNPITKKITNRYEHFDAVNNCVEINVTSDSKNQFTVDDLKDPSGGASAPIDNAVIRVYTDKNGEIDLSSEKNKPLLTSVNAVCEVLKNYPQAVLTLPKEFFDEIGGVKAGEEYILTTRRQDGQPVLAIQKIKDNLFYAKTAVAGVKGRFGTVKTDAVTAITATPEGYSNLKAIIDAVNDGVNRYTDGKADVCLNFGDKSGDGVTRDDYKKQLEAALVERAQIMRPMPESGVF